MVQLAVWVQLLGALILGIVWGGCAFCGELSIPVLLWFCAGSLPVWVAP